MKTGPRHMRRRDAFTRAGWGFARGRYQRLELLLEAPRLFVVAFVRFWRIFLHAAHRSKCGWVAAATPNGCGNGRMAPNVSSAKSAMLRHNKPYKPVLMVIPQLLNKVRTTDCVGDVLNGVERTPDAARPTASRRPQHALC